jgi:hypothetical protein
MKPTTKSLSGQKLLSEDAIRLWLKPEWKTAQQISFILIDDLPGLGVKIA